MEVEFVYKNEIMKHTISPLKTIFYLKNLAANSFNLNKKFVQVFYKENKIKNDNLSIKNYFNNEKYVLLIVKYLENNSNLNTVNNSFETSLINDNFETNKKYNNYLDKLNYNRKRINTISSTKKLINKLTIIKPIKPKKLLLDNLNEFEHNNTQIKSNLKYNFNRFSLHKNTISEITLNEPKLSYEICLECSDEKVNFYCRNCNNFICKNCYKKNHLNHKIIIIEKGNINQALLKYQKNLINDFNEDENKLFHLLNKDQKDFSNLIKNLVEEIKNEFFNFAKAGEKILKIYPNFDYFDKINQKYFIKEKKKILNEFENLNEKNDYFQDFNINKNKNKFLNLQKYELILKDLKKNIENINYKCQFKYLFISILNHVKSEFKEIIEEIEKMYENYYDKLKNNNNENKFFNSIKNFIENYKNLYNIELNFDSNKENESVNLDEPILKKNLQNNDLINKSNPYNVFLNIVNFEHIIKSEKNEEKKINSKYSSFRSINKMIDNPSSSNDFDSSNESNNLSEILEDETKNIIKNKDTIEENNENNNEKQNENHNENQNENQIINNIIDKRRRSNLYLEDKIQVSNKYLKSILSLKKKKKKTYKNQ